MVASFAHTPTVIAPFHNQVDFLPQLLSDITRPQVTRLAVPTKTPHVTQAPGISLFARGGITRQIRFIHPRIVGRDAVWQHFAVLARAHSRAGVDVDAQDLGQKRGSVRSEERRVGKEWRSRGSGCD